MHLEGNSSQTKGFSISHLLNLQNVFGETPLHLAISEENYQACKVLVQKGADVNIAKNKGSNSQYTERKSILFQDLSPQLSLTSCIILFQV